MNLLEMRTKLRKRVGNPDTTDVPNTDLDENINSAYRDIASRFRFHKVRKLCVFDTIIGTKRYGLPTDTEALLRVRNNTRGTKITKEDDSFTARQEGDANEVQGTPLTYARQRDWILLDPTPDAVETIEIYYKAGIADLDSDGLVPILPASWHEGIVKLARHYFYDEKGDAPKAQYALATYTSWLSTKTVEFDEEKSDYDKGVRVVSLERPVRARVSFDEE